MQDFQHTVATPLCEIMGRHKSDKGHLNITSSCHNYTTLYYSLFKAIREAPLRVFELGLGTNNVKLPSNMGANGRPGASLYGWREFFPNAAIFGADIDKDILFNEERIKTYYCDQTSPAAIKEMWSQPDLQEDFDIIVEDGLHKFEANVCFFEQSIHKLKRNGYYVIEDIKNVDLQRFKAKIRDWEHVYPQLRFNLVCIPSQRNHYDNNLLVVLKP